jgi:hypothetical protein
MAARKRKSRAPKPKAATSLLDPPWLLDSPDPDEIEPPVDTLDQVLPFEKLTWKNFERLCLRLSSMDGDAEHWRLYGLEGQEQGGIDIYVRRKTTAKYSVWQSKRHKSFGPARIEDAVSELLPVSWTPRKVFYGTGGGRWNDGNLRESSSSRRYA